MRVFLLSYGAGLAWLLVSCLCLAAETTRESAFAPMVLTNAAQIRNLSAAEAAGAPAVRLRGVVVDESDPRGNALVIADQTAGIYVLGTDNRLAPYHRGDLVEIDGVADPGQFAPIVRVQTARKLGTAPVPKPQQVTYQQLCTGALDGQLVEIAGVVRHCFEPSAGGEVWRMIVAIDGGGVSVRSILPKDPGIKEDAEVRLRAICFYQFNQQRQVLTPVLQVPRGVPVTVEKPAPSDAYAAPVRSAASLLQFAPDASYGHRVHVRGMVTHSEPGSLVWLRDASSGLRVKTRLDQSLQPGDEIDVLGFPVYGSYSPVLEDAVFRKTGSIRPPRPLVLGGLSEAMDHGDDLVALEAELTEVQPVLEGLALSLQRTGTVFKAVMRLPAKQPIPPDWQPGSRVRVAGICSAIHDDDRPLMGVWRAQSFQLLLRSPADVVILARPSWWTARHIMLVLGAISGASILVSGVVMWLARRRLREQEQHRAMAEAEFAAILSERNRVAREIHDTLAQGLVATSVQLRLAKKHANGASSDLTRHLDTAQDLVRTNLEEARSSIWNMRAQVLETGDLTSALRGILHQMAEGAEVQTNIEVKGRARRLAPVIENNLLRIGQEAITNATKHARAKRIELELEYGEKQLELRVRDDGQGFDVAKPPPGGGGFGLVGMRERAATLKGELSLRSAPGEGTEIRLRIPVSGE